MEKMYSEAESLVVLDHHKTSKADCAGLSFCEFDMSRSGCRMAWDHFFPDEDCPAWIKRVEDRDLWRFQYSDTKEYHAYIASLPMTIESWNGLHATHPVNIIEGGESILRYIETSISKTCEQAREVTLASGHTVVVLNITYQNASETASKMLELHPKADYSMTYYQRSDSRWQYSLRSRSEFDVSEIAKSFGGGGHAKAAGFETTTLLPELVTTPGVTSAQES